jgi:hypothetical protein
MSVLKAVLVNSLVLIPIGIALPHVAHAQKSYAIGIGGGAGIPVGKFKKAEKPGAGGMVAIAIGVGEIPVGVRFDGIYNRFHHREELPVGGVADTTTDVNLMGLLANFVVAFPGTTKKAYVLIGAGYYRLKATSSTAETQTSVGYNAGIGATFGIGPFATFIESRYHSISRSEEKGGIVQFVPVTLGLLF